MYQGYVSQPLWRHNMPECFPWQELNGLFVFESSQNFACCAFLSLVFGTRSHTTLFTWRESYALYIPNIFLSETCLKLKSQLGYELLHSALQHTFPTDNKELFFCITFLTLWSNLAPRSAFSQHTSYYFSTIPQRSDMSHPSRKSPTLTL